MYIFSLSFWFFPILISYSFLSCIFHFKYLVLYVQVLVDRFTSPYIMDIPCPLRVYTSSNWHVFTPSESIAFMMQRESTPYPSEHIHNGFQVLLPNIGNAITPKLLVQHVATDISPHWSMLQLLGLRMGHYLLFYRTRKTKLCTEHLHRFSNMKSRVSSQPKESSSLLHKLLTSKNPSFLLSENSMLMQQECPSWLASFNEISIEMFHNNETIFSLHWKLNHSFAPIYK